MSIPRKKPISELAKVFAEMSDEAQEVAVGMVASLVREGRRMGMDEGMNRNGTKKAFRRQLEKLCKDYL